MTPEFDTLSALLHRRHSCRAFTDRPVARTQIERIIATAGRVPSWCNAQPWQVCVTSPAETLKFGSALREHMQTVGLSPDFDFPSGYSEVRKDRRKACGIQLYQSVDIAMGDKDAARAQMQENFRFFGAPHVAVVTSAAELGPYGAVDCGAFVTAFTLAADALGVASIPQAAVAGYAAFVHEYFDLAPDRRMVCAIAFGYADTAHPINGFRTARAPLDEIITWHGEDHP
jgi:nitroreductase